MKIHEYQAKQIFRQFAVPVPAGFPCFSVEECVDLARTKLSGPVYVVKAQIHAGGRGKAGGVKVSRSIDEVQSNASSILGMNLITHQTSSHGQLVRRLLIEEGVDISHEYYFSLVVDRVSQKICMIASSQGGMDIEEVASSQPDAIHRLLIDPYLPFPEEDVLQLCHRLGFTDGIDKKAVEVFGNLFRLFREKDASLVEVNPLVLTGSGLLLALDAKLDFDDNALYRHPDISELRDLDEENPDEVAASRFGLSYIALDGNIGCLVNGAGLAMATMDVIKLYGASPANFLDVGGGATCEKVTEAFRIMLLNSSVKGILVNIFGGIMRCDTIAEGLVAASRELSLSVPLVVRMSGTNEELGRKILSDSGLPVVLAHTMSEAAERIVASVSLAR
ncbi:MULTISPECIES: ADP-forming succinate--CoA ligase subunit beta [Candidatus Ichthyocystis]|uniref:Succinate--CoA ligase [ADP-forming] subunit beta n=1 Tax=Candidatus Ichthyocystis hellenicum TaxID=1561003 RepID=A0A0S4M164_9BURK|nr:MULTISPECIES: ADP-forming succinate--CoA ligase subunit beta [Ichthyocystis]CUT17523.1 succinyl-CoA synthetase subunit beta [Candidatus Ichthyocystis hellenicum]